MASNVIEFKIIGDSKSAQNAINNTNKALKNNENALSKLKKNWLGATAAVASSVLAFKNMYNVFKVQEQAETTLAAAMKQAGTYTQQAYEHNIKYARSLQKLTTYGDEAILGIQKMLTNFGVEGEMLDKLTKATLDLAAAKGMDLKSAADLVSKSVGSSTNALSRYGIVIKGAVGSTERMEIAVSNITKLFGGSAEAKAQSFSGKIEQLSNSFGDLKENIIRGLLPAIEPLLNIAKDAVSVFGELPQSLQSIIGAVALLTPALIGLNMAFGPIGLAITGIAAATIGIGIAFKKWNDKLSVTDKKMEVVNKQIVDMTKNTKNLKDTLDKLTLEDLEAGARLTGQSIRKMINNAKKGVKEFDNQIAELENKLKNLANQPINPFGPSLQQQADIIKKQIEEINTRKNKLQQTINRLDAEYINKTKSNKNQLKQFEIEYTDFVSLQNAKTIQELNSMYDRYVSQFQGNTKALEDIWNAYEETRKELDNQATDKLVNNLNRVSEGMNIVTQAINGDLTGALKSAVTGISSLFGLVGNAIGGVVNSGIDLISSLFKKKDSLISKSLKQTTDNLNKQKDEEKNINEQLQSIHKKTRDIDIKYMQDVTLAQKKELIKRLENEKAKALKELEEIQKAELEKWKIKSGFAKFQEQDYMRDYQRKSFWERKKADYEKALKEKLAKQEEERKQKELEYQNKINQAKIKSAQIEKQIKIAQLQIEKATAIASVKEIKGNEDDKLRAKISNMYNQIISLAKSAPIPSFATGGDFIVPPGYNDDNYLMSVSSGEHVTVTPKNEVNNDNRSSVVIEAVNIIVNDVKDISGAVIDQINKIANRTGSRFLTRGV